VVLLVVVLAPLARTTYTSIRSLGWSQRPSALAQVVAAVVAQVVQRLAAQAQQVVAQQVAVPEAARRQAHAVRQVLAVTDSSWSTKSSRYEQSVRHPWWHRPQHHRP
jgi:hypothetical protein